MIDVALIGRLLFIPLIAAVGITLGLVYKGIDRRLAARMQSRIGPPVRQPFRDVRKLMAKENIVPRDAVGWIFNLMPLIALASSLLLLMYVPFFVFDPPLGMYGDLVLVLYLLLLPSLALVIGGFASGSPYATVGAQREMITMISYEFPLAITIVSLAWLVSMSSPLVAPVHAFSLSTMMYANVWTLVGPIGALGLLLLFVSMLVVTTGEMGAVPFDSAEAETEICGGLFAEYSGRNLALFYLADAVKLVVLGSLTIGLFMPQNLVPLDTAAGNLILSSANILFWLFKLFVVVFLSSTFMRVAFARLRITQVVKVYWGYATVVALLGLLLIGADVLMGVA